VTLAFVLAEEGRAAGSPMALAAAAELFASVSAEDPARTKASEGSPAPAGGAGAAPEPAADSRLLSAEAAAAARARSEEALAVQTELSAAAASGRQALGGLIGRRRDEVAPFGTDVYRVTYRGGETARATAMADRRYDIYLYVLDAFGNVIDHDNDAKSIGACARTPDIADDFTLKVKNETGSSVSCLIYAN
jgi:hypothetical protein